MQCSKSFTIEVGIDCDPIAEATWTQSKLGPGPGSVTMVGGDGTFELTDTGDPNGGNDISSLSSSLECPATEYSVTIEIDYNVFLQDFGAGSSAGMNIVARRNGAAVIFYTGTAPNNSTFSDSGTLTSAPLQMNFDEAYTFQIQILYSVTGGGICNTSGTVRIRPLTPP